MSGGWATRHPEISNFRNRPLWECFQRRVKVEILVQIEFDKLRIKVRVARGELSVLVQANPQSPELRRLRDSLH